MRMRMGLRLHPLSYAQKIGISTPSNTTDSFSFFRKERMFGKMNKRIFMRREESGCCSRKFSPLKRGLMCRRCWKNAKRRSRLCWRTTSESWTEEARSGGSWPQTEIASSWLISVLRRTACICFGWSWVICWRQPISWTRLRPVSWRIQYGNGIRFSALTQMRIQEDHK